MRICWRKLGILHGPAFLPWRRPPYRLRRPRFATQQPSAGDPRQARGFASARQSRGCRTPDLFALNKWITHLVRAGRLGEARAAFDAAGCRNTVTWNCVERRNVLSFCDVTVTNGAVPEKKMNKKVSKNQHS
ncbi:hypothetical protein NL676_029813 [Syzygium grande]|nr:hypothetical protein NL676_029813 [Syzygium grande]